MYTPISNEDPSINGGLSIDYWINIFDELKLNTFNNIILIPWWLSCFLIVY